MDNLTDIDGRVFAIFNIHSIYEHATHLYSHITSLPSPGTEDAADRGLIHLVTNEISRLVLLIHAFFPHLGINYCESYVIRLLANIVEIGASDAWMAVRKWAENDELFKGVIRSSFVVANGVLILSNLDDSGARPMVVFSADGGELLAGATDPTVHNNQVGVAIGFL
jgi:hypothetical protein